MSYLEVRGYQSSKSKCREHLITGEKETDIFHWEKEIHIRKKEKGKNNGQKLCKAHKAKEEVFFMLTFVEGFDSQRENPECVCVWMCALVSALGGTMIDGVDSTCHSLGISLLQPPAL